MELEPPLFSGSSQNGLLRLHKTAVLCNIHLKQKTCVKELLFWCTGFLSSLFGGGSNKEEALEMYSRAANLFKMAKQWGQAGNTFCTIGRRGSGQVTWLA